MFYDVMGAGLITNADSSALGLSTALSNPSARLTLSTAPRFTGQNNIPDGLLPAAPKAGFPQVAPNLFAITNSLDDNLLPPYTMNTSFSIGREFKGGWFVQGSYVGRLSRRSLVSEDVAMPTNLKDPASGVTYFQAATQLAKLVNANPAMQPLLNNILDEKAFIDMSEPTFRVVPTKAVGKGDTWDLTTNLKLGPIGSYASAYKYTYEGKEGALDKISIAATLKYEPGTSASGSLPFKIENAKLESTKAAGSVLFDNAKGRAEKSSMNMEVKGTLTIDIGGQKTAVDINQSQSTTFETSDANPVKK